MSDPDCEGCIELQGIINRTGIRDKLEQQAKSEKTIRELSERLRLWKERCRRYKKERNEADEHISLLEDHLRFKDELLKRALGVTRPEAPPEHPAQTQLSTGVELGVWAIPARQVSEDGSRQPLAQVERRSSDGVEGLQLKTGPVGESLLASDPPSSTPVQARCPKHGTVLVRAGGEEPWCWPCAQPDGPEDGKDG